MNSIQEYIQYNLEHMYSSFWTYLLLWIKNLTIKLHMFDTTLLVVTRLMCDHYMGTSSKDEMYSRLYKSNIYILWNNYIHVCTEKQHITLLIYKHAICTSSTYHIWRQIITHETISSCHIGFKGFLKAVFQILSDKVHRCIHQNITISSTLTRAWRGLEPTQTT